MLHLLTRFRKFHLHSISIADIFIAKGQVRIAADSGLKAFLFFLSFKKLFQLQNSNSHRTERIDLLINIGHYKQTRGVVVGG